MKHMVNSVGASLFGTVIISAFVIQFNVCFCLHGTCKFMLGILKCTFNTIF